MKKRKYCLKIKEIAQPSKEQATNNKQARRHTHTLINRTVTHTQTVSTIGFVWKKDEFVTLFNSVHYNHLMK